MIGRGVRALSEYGAAKGENQPVRYPHIHVKPLDVDSLFDDFFSPIARDGASIREVQIRLLKALSMLARGWPEIFSSSAKIHGLESLAYFEKQQPIGSDKEKISQLWRQLFPEG